MRLIAGQCFAQIHAENFELSVACSTENLRVVDFRVGRHVAGQIDRIAEVRGSIRDMVPGISHLTSYGNHGRIFKIKPPKHAHRVKRLQDETLIFTRKRIFQIESQYFGRVIRSLQADDLCVRLVRLRQYVAKRFDEIRDFHSLAVCILARPENMAVEVHGLVCERKNRRNSDLVTVLDVEIFQYLRD